jgi:hypothetical protein
MPEGRLQRERWGHRALCGHNEPSRGARCVPLRPRVGGFMPKGRLQHERWGRRALCGHNKLSNQQRGISGQPRVSTVPRKESRFVDM